MRLRIIDQSSNHNTKIRICLENEHRSDDFFIDSYNSPLSPGFIETLEWYFKDYLLNFETTSGDRNVGEKLIKFGQYICDELLGEDHQLLKFKDTIESSRYETIEVQLESARVDFFKEWWEINILFESKYVLSAVTKSYTRCILQNNDFNQYSGLNYGLKINLDVNDKLKDSSSIDVDMNDAQIDHQPLQVFYLVSRPESKSSNIINTSLMSGRALNYELHQYLKREELESRFSDAHDQIHIFHYDGPIIIENDKPHIVLEIAAQTSTLISVTDLAAFLVAGGVGALFLDASDYLKNNHSILASEGLALVAQSAHQQGLGNVVGLHYITNPWISRQCFDAIYAKILHGFSLEQAIVEARKSLQANIETSLTTQKPISFHSWSLLSHYSLQSVVFFEQPIVKATDSNENIDFQNKLFGFKSAQLPPLLKQVGDCQLIPLINSLSDKNHISTRKVVSIIGDNGSGKTQAAHLVSLYLAKKHDIDFGFYFNFSKEFYTSKDILEMLAPILDLNSTDLIEAEQRLAKLHCCFVLDDISMYKIAQDNSNNNSQKSITELCAFLKKLSSQGHIILLVGELSPQISLELSSLISYSMEITPLSLIEQKIIAADVLRHTQSTDPSSPDKDLNNLLLALNGNPWLAKKVIPLLQDFSITDLIAQCNQLHQRKDMMSEFYQWQWGNLNRVWQRLLILCSNTPGLLLEMLMVATNQAETYSNKEILFDLLGDSKAKLHDGLLQLEKSGFLARYPHGRVIDPACLKFLHTQHASTFEEIDEEKCNLYFSQVICEKIQILADNLIKNPNPSISNNLLINRGQWRKHLETIWFAEDYRSFIKTKLSFDQLLTQAKLEAEGYIWIINLLERSPLPNFNSSLDQQLSWLSLASSSIKHLIEKSGKIEAGVDVWRNWFDTQLEVTKNQLVLFVQVTTFLEAFYRHNAMWSDAIEICKKAYNIFSNFHAWYKAIQSLRSLSIYSFEIGDHNKALFYENKILDDIPYEGAQPGFKTQQMLDILQLRLVRADVENARALLEVLRKSDDAVRLKDMLDSVEAGISAHESKAILA